MTAKETADLKLAIWLRWDRRCHYRIHVKRSTTKTAKTMEWHTVDVGWASERV